MQAVPERRGRSITSRIRAMVMIPTTALVVLWLVLTVALAGDAVVQRLRADATDDLVAPAAIGLVDVMRERTQTVAHIENPGDAQIEGQLAEARESTDDSLGTVVGELIGFADIAPGESGHHIEMLHAQYGEIDAIRAAVDAGEASRTDVLDYYNELILHGADSFDSQTRAGGDGNGAVNPSFTATYMFRTVDLFALSDAQIAHAFATDELTLEEQRRFTELVGSYESMLAANGHYLEGEGQEARLENLLASQEYADLQRMQDEIIDRQVTTETVTDPVTLVVSDVQDLSMPVDYAAWDEAYDHVLSELTAIGADEALYAAEVTRAEANQALVFAVAGSLGVAAVIAFAFVLARRSSNALTERLLRLRDDSNDLSENRLPDLMRRLHEGERVDTEAALPALAASDDELGDVARAFNTAQRAAVNAAVQQTELRQGVNRVFLNIAHRSQTLVHRQLRLLDRMEREQEDPEQLAQLFKLDHLATRSRRNAENLLILGGEAPGRTWHRPMPLIDVLRGAISESGDYTRVKRERIARVHLNGPAVADVIHLVAELVDNAAMFSPPHTHVRLSSEDVPNGVTVEIEDRGLGMTESEFASANALLSSPPEFDVMRLNEKMRLGLFVVSHLAHRHGIRVHLRPSPYGGVQAIVLLPHELISGDRSPLPSDESGEHVWDVREILDRTPGGELSSGRRVKPVLTSVSAPKEEAPARKDEDPADSAGGEGDDTVTAEAAEAPAGGADLLDADGDRPPLPIRTPAVSAVPDPDPSAAEPPAMVEAGGGRPPLPKRRPQENLAPQLAADPAADTQSGPATAGGSSSNAAQDGQERLARLRRNMSAFQKGTDRGRREGKQQTNDTDKDA
ncbi:nitrate- and nitrite sensing domain-containing protein [Nocardiopsis dassonvillei]|uniref:nitrate- and nitrite sensing domain-containing protein n=1 Tax=Nocardiopsis dassonvillei TaxID=2014 RepID=UPI000B9D603A|nr:nitrate- and nitrite sensing domain-containing protein [Nocardiopsis dassonvillei]ASU56943.1 histidine kinase [Nocardiopsis dassonvillei]